MKRYLVLGAFCILAAYGLGVRDAGGAYAPGDGKCYLSVQGQSGCSCGATSCGDCIQGSPDNYCRNGEFGTTCQPQTIPTTEVSCSGHKFDQQERFCGEVWACDTSPCPNPCIYGAFRRVTPGTFTQNYATAQCPPCDPQGG
jgi:hypothetical protein